jgi:hypothetical protein
MNGWRFVLYTVVSFKIAMTQTRRTMAGRSGLLQRSKSSMNDHFLTPFETRPVGEACKKSLVVDTTSVAFVG